RRAQPGPDHARMRRRAERPITESLPQGRDGRRQYVANSDSLIVRQSDGAVLAPGARATADERHPGAEGDRPILPAGKEADRSGHQHVTQIMVVSKERPRRCLAAKDGEGDRGPSLKQPPGEATLGRTVDPVGLQPYLDVLVTGDCHELLISPTHGASQGSTAHLRDRAINGA